VLERVAAMGVEGNATGVEVKDRLSVERSRDPARALRAPERVLRAGRAGRAIGFRRTDHGPAAVVG